jgi:hypothetical protein
MEDVDPPVAAKDGEKAPPMTILDVPSVTFIAGVLE